MYLVGASGGQGAALDLRRVFDPFETRFAIMVKGLFGIARACLYGAYWSCLSAPSWRGLPACADVRMGLRVLWLDSPTVVSRRAELSALS